MGTRSRLALLLLTAISAVIGPSNQVPGARSEVVHVHTLPCTEQGCQGQGQSQPGYRYVCDECGHVRYFCAACSRQLTSDEAAEHTHTAGLSCRMVELSTSALERLRL
jgi:hypothetical protein